ncbi:hypothetical protein EHP00_1640 [Ecytonucleospora hepatopenaei]|uniref:Uncharacterized protein n=1 Tax=Ecytonucleospora hepatopenaei TaxID=646526 RepID=A0A1W0E3I4_9MICR|nr:hypothetical protein EHP00_1640 [Ecytonucleospora hepatopenaei]
MLPTLFTIFGINIRGSMQFEGPRDPCGQPLYCEKRDECVPNEKANEALRDFEILLTNWSSNLQTASKTAIENVFSTFHSSFNSITTKDAAEVKNLIDKLEDDVLAAVILGLTNLQASLEKTVTSEFSKLNAADLAILKSIETKIANVVEFLAGLPEDQAALAVRTTEFGLQYRIFELFDVLFAQQSAAGIAAESNLLFHITHEISEANDIIKAAIAKLFKDFFKALKCLDCKYAAELKKIIDTARYKLESEINHMFTTITQRDSYFLIATAKKIVELLTGCAPSSNVDPLPFLLRNSGGTMVNG